MNTIRLSSCDHPIDLRRAAQVERFLHALSDNVEVAAVLQESSRDPNAYVGRLVDSLFRQEADAAVCPAAFLSAGVPQGIEVAAVHREGEPSYICVAVGEPDLRALEPGAKVAAWDAVSRAQLSFLHPDLSIAPIHSWSDLFEDLRHGAWSAACLPPYALAAGNTWGLRTSPIDPDHLLPAIGQSEIALLSLAGYAHPLVASLNDPATERRLRFECAFWRCAMEIPDSVATASASLNGDMVSVTGLIAGTDGTWLVRDEGEAAVKFGEFVAEDVAESCKRAVPARWSHRAAS